MKIKFKHLKKASELGDDFLIEYFNRFKGDDIHQKTINILKTWERDVSYDTGFSSDGKNIKISLEYLIQEIEILDKDPIVIHQDSLEYFLNIPNKFYPNHDIFKLENIVQQIKHKDKCLDVSSMFDILPPKSYNILINTLLTDCSKTASFSNITLQKFKINFLGNSPYEFLKGLFNPYSDDYYRDIIYHLSNKIGAKTLFNSTMKDIDYYVDKMNVENSQEKVPDIA